MRVFIGRLSRAIAGVTVEVQCYKVRSAFVTTAALLVC